ncbi:MAG: hypothetical protein NTZ85_01075 [Bacteroidia bacterium]|jgi:ligand-binding sensor domain-containing protein|nr:hypothetical protein [Bacteroidia bacterium]
MKKGGWIRISSVIAGALLILIFFTACEQTKYDLLDQESAGVWTLYNSANSDLPGNYIWDLQLDQQGNLWVACNGNGVAVYGNNTWQVYTTQNSSLLSDSVTTVDQIADGSMLIGTKNGYSVRSSAGVWKNYTDPAVTTMRISTVKVTSTGKVWIGTYNEGLYIDEGAGLVHNSSGFDVYAIEEDKSGNIWLGSNYGLIKWNGIAWENINVTKNLPEGPVTALLSDTKGRMWIGIYGNKEVYRIVNSKLDSLSLMNGPFGNVIWDICEDIKGDIWFATWYDGLIRYDGVIPHAYKEYNVTDGEGNSIIEDFVNCIEKDEDGNMWFGLDSKGLIKYTLPLK